MEQEDMSRCKDPTRLAAIANGDKTYEGNPCKAYGHTLRHTYSGGCVECDKIKLSKWRQTQSWKEYQRQYMEIYRNTDHGKEIMKKANTKYQRRKHDKDNQIHSETDISKNGIQGPK